jgi:L-lactate dehydrogenase
MTRKIGIIGLGHVGSTVAHQLIIEGLIDDLVLIDINEDKVNADALDFQDAAANLNSHVNIIVNSYEALKDADIIISAIGNIKLSANESNDRFAELPFTAAAVNEIAPKIKESGFNGIIVAISNPVDVITSMYQELTGLPKKHVIGTGTLLDSSRMKRAVGRELNIDSRSVSGYNLGEHGNSQFVAWSTVRALGKPISELADSEKLNELETESISGGHRVFWGKGYTNYGISAAAVRLVKAILNDAHEELPVSNYYELLKTYLGYPAIVGRDGIIQQLKLNLNEEESNKLTASSEFIKSKLNEWL